MSRERLGKGFMILVAFVTLMAIDIVTPATAPADKVLTMNVNREGTSGYAVGTTIAQTISKYSDLKVSGVPYTSPVAGFRRYSLWFSTGRMAGKQWQGSLCQISTDRQVLPRHLLYRWRSVLDYPG